MRAILMRPVFSVDGEEHRWEDVLAAARVWGDWARLEARAADGLVCRHRADREGDPLAADDVRSAAKAFRYSHGLLAAEEMEAWLERWGLDLDRWMAYLRRTLLREHWSTELEEMAPRFPASVEEVEQAADVEAICSDALLGWARALAARAATHSALGSTPRPTVALLDESFRRFGERAVTLEALERLVTAREIDWLRVDGRSLAVADEQMAREAALCVRHDGLGLAAVAELAAGSVETVNLYLEDAEPALRQLLLSADPGELLGPVAAGDEFTVLVVETKTLPTLDDRVIRERAERELVRRAVEQELRDRVRWHEL